MLARARKVFIGAALSLALAIGSLAAPAQAALPTNSIEPGEIAGVDAVVPLSSVDRIAEWQKLQFGLFMHWGVYSMFEGIYKGQVQGIGYPEQIKVWMKIPDSDYLAEAAQMDAAEWDAGQICQTARDTGMKYVKITTKHHDGFAMWDTKTTDFNVVKQTAFGKDPIAQLAEECNKRDIKLAFYFSIIDWTQHEAEPYQNLNPIPETMMPLIKAQLTELLSNYGPISEVWFDMGKPTADQSARMVQWVRELQPETVVNSRVWNDKGDFEVGGDNAVHADLRMGPWESILSIFPSCWSYCSTYKANRDPANIVPKSKSAISALATVISGGGQFAFNIGPKGDGSVDPFDQAVLDNIGAWMKRHPDAITGAKATWFPVPDWGRVTANGSDLYFMVPKWTPGSVITLPGLANAVTSVTVDGSGQSLEYTRDGLDLKVTLSGDTPDPMMSVIKVSLDGAPKMIPAQSVVIAERAAVVTGSDVVGRLSAKGRGFTAMDGYVVNPEGEAVALDLAISATGLKAETEYRVSFGEQSFIRTGAQLSTSALEGLLLPADSTERIRIEYAEPAYYADALNLTNVKFTVHSSTASELLADLRDETDRYVAEGTIAGPIAKQLAKALEQADKHLAAGRNQPASVAVTRFIDHLDHPKKPDTLGAEAAAALKKQAETLLALIGG